MRLAYVVSDLSYPAREGLHEQTLRLLQALRTAGISVDLYGYCQDPDRLDLVALADKEGLVFAAPPITDRRTSLAVGLSNRFSRTCCPATQRLLQKLHRKDYDVLHLEAAAACGLARQSIPAGRVLSFVDPPSRRQVRLARAALPRPAALRHVAGAAAGYVLESSLRDPRDTWTVVSDSDASYLRRVHRHHRVLAIPVMLAPALAHESDPPSPGAVYIVVDLRQPHMRRALIAFARHVLAPAATLVPDLQVVVLGRTSPPTDVVAACSGLPLSFVEWAPSFAAAIRSAAVVVAPDTAGSGLKNRVVQAMAYGAPVLGSTVAFEGLAVRSGTQAIVYASYAEALDGLVRLWKDPTFRHAVADAGKRFALQNFGAATVTSTWMAVYEAAARPGR